MDNDVLFAGELSSPLLEAGLLRPMALDLQRSLADNVTLPNVDISSKEGIGDDDDNDYEDGELARERERRGVFRPYKTGKVVTTNLLTRPLGRKILDLSLYF